MSTRLTAHFTLEELSHSNTAQSHGIDNTPPQEVKDKLTLLAIDILEPIRQEYGKPIHITSGYRCPELNRLVGGVSNSQHVDGSAVDINQGSKKANKELYDLIVRMAKKEHKITFR